MDILDFITVMVIGLAAGYITRSLLLEEKESHEGFMATWRWKVVFRNDDGDHIQRFALPDIIRFLFGAYTKRGNIFFVHSSRSEVFTCSFCLSFWVCLAIVLFSIAFFDISVLKSLIYIFASASISRWVAQH